MLAHKNTQLMILGKGKDVTKLRGIAKKLGISPERLDGLIENTNHVYSDFPNRIKYLNLLRFLSRIVNKITGHEIKVNY